MIITLSWPRPAGSGFSSTHVSGCVGEISSRRKYGKYSTDRPLRIIIGQTVVARPEDVLEEANCLWCTNDAGETSL